MASREFVQSFNNVKGSEIPKAVGKCDLNRKNSKATNILSEIQDGELKAALKALLDKANGSGPKRSNNSLDVSHNYKYDG
ncbi:hypothetical protein HPP92_008351 [Vanilla planifolia]|uniref:Uncharacterized protein n=1 Tax=Vanilla planifolia TaxID=51239 RepID=A0A835RE60_VANPL|nr:hypothetical protein HPP92_008351 [Vanilla planifolia]